MSKNVTCWSDDTPKDDIKVPSRVKKMPLVKWSEFCLYGLWMGSLGLWSLFVSEAIFLSLYCIVAGLLVAVTPLIFRLPKWQRRLTLKLCSRGLLLLTGFCIVLLWALTPAPAHGQFLNGAETWLHGVMPESIHTAITLTINAIRAVFIYLAGTKLSEAYRESRGGEGTAEFMTLAREPIKGGLIVAASDLVILLFAGEGSTEAFLNWSYWG